uniref:Uncharacterized protein n=1 Tax=Amphiprion ocellaris TaxID=80972 RepID=A0AAQ5YVG0_AMPOC
ITGKPSIREGKSSIRTGKSSIREGKSSIRTGKSSIRTGKSSIRTGKSNIRTGKSSIRTGKSSIRKAYKNPVKKHQTKKENLASRFPEKHGKNLWKTSKTKFVMKMESPVVTFPAGLNIHPSIIYTVLNPH